MVECNIVKELSNFLRLGGTLNKKYERQYCNSLIRVLALSTNSTNTLTFKIHETTSVFSGKKSPDNETLF